jgi:peptidoglycan/xylan/chitin deacetylase (PgdA/CDA1 family)
MKLACLTLDTEFDLHSDRCDIELFSDKSKLSIFRDIVFKHEIKINGFLATKILECNPGLIDNALSELPIVFEIHSHSHNQNEPDSQKEIDTAMELYFKYFGRAPKGYRAPNGLISKAGLQRLIQRGFQYDSSIFPSYRFDEYGYNNLHLPVDPFIYDVSGNSILEIPFGAIRTVRVIFCLSYAKLLGTTIFKSLVKLFGLPDILLINSHPYDYFIKNHLANVSGWKRWAHARNAEKSLQVFEELIITVKKMGYHFVHIDDIIENLDMSKLKKIDL